MPKGKQNTKKKLRLFRNVFMFVDNIFEKDFLSNFFINLTFSQSQRLKARIEEIRQCERGKFNVHGLLSYILFLDP